MAGGGCRLSLFLPSAGSPGQFHGSLQVDSSGVVGAGVPVQGKRPAPLAARPPPQRTDWLAGCRGWGPPTRSAVSSRRAPGWRPLLQCRSCRLLFHAPAPALPCLLLLLLGLSIPSGAGFALTDPSQPDSAGATAASAGQTAKRKRKKERKTSLEMGRG